MTSALGEKRTIAYYQAYVNELMADNSTEPNVAQLTCAIASAVLTIPAFANIFIIYGIIVTPNLHNPSFLLITNLAVSDLGVALCGQPVNLAVQILEYCGNYHTSLQLMEPSLVLSVFFSAGSMLTLSAISIDRYLAVRLKMQFSNTVTVKRALGTIILIWLASTVNATSALYMNHRFTSAFNTAGLLLMDFTMLVFYYKSHKLLHKQSSRVGSQENRSSNRDNIRNMNIPSFKNTLMTMIIVVTCLIVSYIPMTGVMLTLAIHITINRNTAFAYYISSNIIHFNSTLNPIILISRIKPIRKAVKKTLGLTSH